MGDYQQAINSVIARKKSGGGGCSVLWDTTGSVAVTDFWSTNIQMSQRLKVTSPTTVCEVTFICYLNGAGTADVTVEFWDTSTGGGTQYGTASIPTTVTSIGGNTYYSFTWAVNPILTTDCYMLIKKNAGGDVVFTRTSTDPTDYEDTNYNFHRTGNLNQDLLFTLSTI